MGEVRWRRVGAVAATAAALVVAWRLRAVLTPFALALVLAYLLEPLVSLLERRQVPRAVAILTVYLALGLAAGVVWARVVPSAARELEQLARSLPEQTRRWNAAVQATLSRLRIDGVPEVARRAAQALAVRAEQAVEAVAARLGNLVVATLSQALNLVLTPVLAYYILKDRERLARALLELVPAARRPAVVALALEVDRTLAGVIRGQLLVSMTVGAAVAAGLALLQVPYAVVLGLLTGLLDIVPYFGPVAAGVPILALSLARSPSTALWALVLLVAANQLEGALLQPRVMSRTAGLHPLVVIGAVLTGAEVAGVVGMLLAVPAASVARDVLRFSRRTPYPPAPTAAHRDGPIHPGSGAELTAAGQGGRAPREEAPPVRAEAQR